ncbi:hypothetical protein SSP531S_27500 [Streptomyces spongiicola]|uniref:Uncharacterized protein n=1 Tax=Streptomyces spongiicola TaxID=1690221 RepID=A0A388SXF8_9ACTN|nr:hypothetical protein [Streptomyces spongiicola]GBQ01317.1 hypothetical protein SSP531S_27500 [Streptomyces spongiicola]
MPEDRPAGRRALPPVRLPSEAELARDALGAPLLARAVRLARWAGPETRVGAGGELAEEQLAPAAQALGLHPDDDGRAYASEAWRIAVDTGLVEAADPEDDGAEYGTVTAGGALPLVAGGGPQDVLALWQDAFDAVFADAIAPVLEDPDAIIGPDGRIDFDALGWDPEVETEFLDGVLGNLYLLTVGETGAAEGQVPLPALAASMIVPDDMREPTDAVLEQVSDAMMRLDDQFRVLEPIGLVEYRPVDEALMAEEGADSALPAEEEDFSRYGLVKLTPLGLYGVRNRLIESGESVPALGDLADEDADALLDGVAHYPDGAAQAETAHWLDGRAPAQAARELLAAARGADPGAPLRRLRCQQALAMAGPEAEPAVRDVLDDRELGGLARVWLAERGSPDVPPPPEAMVFWLAVDTIAAQLDAEGDLVDLQDLIVGLVGRHGGFFDAVWRVDHPATVDVLEAMGRLHPDKKTAKDARKAAFKARSRS